MLKRFIQFYKPHKGLFALDMGVALAASIITIFFPFLTRKLLKVYIPNKDVKMIVTLLVLLLGIYALASLFSYIRIKWGHILGTRMEFDMRNHMFRHLQKLSFNYYDNVKTGHIMSRITNDLNFITEVAHHAPEDLIISACVIIGAFIFMFSFNIYMALFSLIPLPVMILWGIIFGRKMKKNFRLVRETIADINSTVENAVQGIREVKSYANEEREIVKFLESNHAYRKSKENVFTLMGVFFAVMHFLRKFYYLTVISAGAWFIYIGDIDVPDLVGFLLYVSVILPPIDRLINFVEQYYQGITAFERFIEVMDIEPDIEDRRNAYAIEKVKGEITFNEVTFRYKSSTDVVIKDMTISVPSGQSIAIVGESGAGKSTIASLVPRFYEPTSGDILIDGHNIMDLKQQFLRESIGLVQQNVFLFDTTIRDNISYGMLGADEEQIITAARQANIWEFIESLPQGLDTQVGERGVKLSGGQKQRISIARVFLKNPPILIFDEATSALDTDSEKMIQKSLVELSVNRTTIIIAHRLSTVRHVDKIYVMKKGEVVESGTHRALLNKKGYYYNLYSRDRL